jgi:hypothetical protein
MVKKFLTVPELFLPLRGTKIVVIDAGNHTVPECSSLFEAKEEII